LGEAEQLRELRPVRRELAHPRELEERDDAVRELSDVAAEHADELLAGALEALQILVLGAEIVLHPLHVDGVADAGEELDRLDRLFCVTESPRPRTPAARPPRVR